MSEKLKTIAEVVKTIPDGSHIALGGFAIARNNTSVSHELIRQQKKDLVLSQSVVGFETDLLVGAGLVKRLIMGGGSLDRFGPVHCVNRAREASRDFADDYSSLSITFRYLAGALGISFIPIKCLLASEILEKLEAGPASSKDVSRMKCPFTGEEYLLMRALNPDVSLSTFSARTATGTARSTAPSGPTRKASKPAIASSSPPKNWCRPKSSGASRRAQSSPAIASRPSCISRLAGTQPGSSVATTTTRSI